MPQTSKTIRIPIEIHDKIKLQATKEGIYVYELIDKTVTQYIDKRTKGK